MGALTNTDKNISKGPFTKTDSSISGEKLSRVVSGPFVVSFHRKLQNKYRFDSLEKKNLKEFQKFLDNISQMSITEADNRYKRRPDKEDMVDGQQVQHYEVTEKFRIHGVIISGRLEVVRLDPNHGVHK